MEIKFKNNLYDSKKKTKVKGSDIYMAIQDIVSKVTKGIEKEVTKVASSLPLEYIYVGYLVSKGTSLENTNINGAIRRDFYMFTYITLEPSFFVLMEDGMYKDIETGNKYPKLEYYNLVSKHLESGMDIDHTKYPAFGKNDFIGVFNLTKFETIVDKQIDAELNSKDITLKLNTQKKKSYTPLEIIGIYKRYRKGDFNKKAVRTFIVPPVLKDELDSIKTVFGLESKFVMQYYGKSEEEIYNDLLAKSDEYLRIRN